MASALRRTASGVAAGALLLGISAGAPGAEAQDLPLGQPAGGSLVAAHDHISDADARLQLARLLSYQPHRRAEALAHYRRLLDEAPEDPELLAETAEVLHWAGDDAAAAALLLTLPERAERTRASLLLHARVELSLGRPGRARVLLESVQPLEGRTERLLYVAALSGTGALHPAAAILREKLDDSPEDHELRLQLGDLLQMQGQIYAAEHQYALILARDTEHPFAKERIQRLPHRRSTAPADETGTAEQSAGPPSSAQELLQVAEDLTRQDRLKEAEEAVRQALEREPELIRAQYLLAELLISRGALAEATEPLEAITARFPDATRARLTLAQLASWQGDYEHSLRLYDELAAAYPEDPVFPWEAARVAGWAGERDEAQGRYAALLASVQAGDIGVQRSSGAAQPLDPIPIERAVALPAHPRYPAQAVDKAVRQEAEAKALISERRPREALAILQRAALFQPHNLETALDQSQVECALGLCDAERATYQRVLDVVPGHDIARNRLKQLERQRAPQAGFHAEYRDESGRDAQLETTGYGVHGSVALGPRWRGSVALDRQHHRFDPGPADALDAVYGNRIHGAVRGVASSRLRWRAELAHTRFDDSEVQNSTEGRAEADYHFNDQWRAQGSLAQERVLRNPETARDRIYRRVAEVDIDHYPDRRLDLAGTLRSAHYSDGNRGTLLQFQPRLRVTEHPHQLTTGATLQYRDTEDEVDAYWTPQDYFAAGPFLEWRHDLADLFACRAMEHYYRLRLSSYRDNDRNTGWRLAGAYTWDASDRLQLSGDAFIERSSEWDTEGARLSATWHFH